MLLQLILVLGLLLVPAPVFAIIMLTFQSVPGSVSLAGGPRNATLNFGNVSAFEPLNTGVSRSRTAANYTLSTNFGVHVRRLVGLSANYSLQARLRNANALTWRVDGMTMSTTAATVATSQPYGTTVPHLLAFVVPFSHAAGAVTMVLEVTAIAN